MNLYASLSGFIRNSGLTCLDNKTDVVVIVTTKTELCLTAIDEFDEINDTEKAYYILKVENAEVERIDAHEEKIEEDDEFRIHKRIHYKFVIKIKDANKHARVDIAYEENENDSTHYRLIYAIHYIHPDTLI